MSESRVRENRMHGSKGAAGKVTTRGLVEMGDKATALRPSTSPLDD